MNPRLRDRLFWGLLVLLTAVSVTFAELVMIVTPRADRERRYFGLTRLWARAALAAHRVRIDHAERIPRDGPVLFVSNHQSNMDIFLLHALVGHPFHWFCRHDMFDWPFVGRALRRLGAIPVERTSGRRAARALRAGVTLIEQGKSVLIFPEGTWGDADGRMRAFKDGTAMIVRHTGVTVVPLSIVGSNEANPPPTNRVHVRPMRILVHEPIPYSAWDDAPGAAILARLRTVIAGPLPHGEALALDADAPAGNAVSPA